MFRSADTSFNSSFEGNDQKRRSSSRSIKRKRFDDEIVEYSLGLGPQGRSRTQSQSQSLSGMPYDVTPMTPTTPISAPPVLNPVSSINPVQNLIQNVAHQSNIIEKRGKMKNNKKSKRRQGISGMSIKDLGRWKPTDDLSLIIGIQQTNDMRTVYRGTKFSCKFTLQELNSRWYSLLYDESISRIAVAAMRNLHPEMIESVQVKALYSKAEEEILSTIKSNSAPDLSTFQDLLNKNAIFYPARTPKALMIHWELMKQYSLLPDQTVQSITSPDALMSFSDCEETLNDQELMAEVKDENLEIELALADRRNKREIRTIENELSRWSVLVDSMSGVGIFSPEFDNQTLAILRGRTVRYLMRSREITFGRSTLKDNVVDVDLSLEGPAYKVSRKHGTIKMRPNGDFFIVNEGKRPIFVDGVPLLTGNKTKLHNNNVIELSGLRFIFLINYDLNSVIRQESTNHMGPLI